MLIRHKFVFFKHRQKYTQNNVTIGLKSENEEDRSGKKDEETEEQENIDTAVEFVNVTENVRLKKRIKRRTLFIDQSKTNVKKKQHYSSCKLNDFELWAVSTMQMIQMNTESKIVSFFFFLLIVSISDAIEQPQLLQKSDISKSAFTSYIGYRNVVLYDSTNPEDVAVYSVLCPDGFFQSSIGNCFNKCHKDEAIVVVRHSTTLNLALGYCNNKKHYCNENGSTVFELASENDMCSAMHSTCQETKELLPDCSCVPRCPSGQVRSFSSNFICKPQMNAQVTASQSSSRDTTIQKSSQKPVVTTSANLGDTTDYLLTIVLVSVAAFVAIIFGLLFLIYKLYHRKDRTDYQGVPAMDGQSTETCPTESESAHTSNGIPLGKGTKIKNETTHISKATYNAARDVIIHNGALSPVTAPEETDIINTDHSDDLQMDELKPPNGSQIDSGTGWTREHTSLKKPY